MIAEFCTEEYANMFARKAALETGKPTRVAYDREKEKFQVYYEEVEES